MKHIQYIFAGLLAGSLAFSSCSSDFLDTYPTDGISEAVLKTPNDLYIALNGIHRKMVSDDRAYQGMGGEPGFIVCREINGDDMTWHSYTGWHTSLLTWVANISESSNYNVYVWRTYYEFILNCNKILEKWDELSDLEKESSLAQQVKGETTAFRAWCHFQLVQYYAHRYDGNKTNTQPGIPIKTSSEVELLSRSTVEETYKFINDELQEAAVLLKGIKPSNINHYSEKVIYGFLARVALTQQKYKEAGDYAAKAIELAEADGNRIMTLDQADPAKNPTAFQEISSTTKDALYAALTTADQLNRYYSFYGYMSWNYNATAVKSGVKCINSNTYNMISPTDIRRAWWDPTGTASVPATSYAKQKYQNRKFTARNDSESVGDYPFMRLTEIYLIASEAYARAGETAKAKGYFSKFIAERDPAYVDSGRTGADFAEEVMVHRRIELWGEGFRFFDLKRLNLPNDRRNSNFIESFCGFLFKDSEQSATGTYPVDGWVYEIPRSETLYNPNMVKNYGQK